MDKNNALIVAQQYAEVILSHFNDAEIYLFGSFAKGTNNDESDIDIAIVFSNYTNLLEIQLELMKLRRKIDSRIEPHPFRKEDFTQANPLAYEIISHGKQLYKNIA
jgi:predicted nucleotidyltransferase